MPESHNVEYKESWHDDYLKWICGFANADGGTIYIGIDDNEKIKGVENYKKLLEDIPNKIRNSMGIVCDVSLRSKKKKYYIEIKVNPYSIPISLRGRYYVRSGSTKTELTGAALTEFLLKKAGKTWDEVAEDRAKLKDIDKSSVKLFETYAKKSKRLLDIKGLKLQEVMEKLMLNERDKLRRAAIVLFGKYPNKFYANIAIKIGRFDSNERNLISQDVIEDNIFNTIERVTDLLDSKYLTKKIEFDGMHRIEKGEYPIPALREMLLNAIVHRSYMGAMIQIRVYDDKISIWNEGTLPEGISLSDLKSFHISKPRNPIIADVCFKAGYIEAWGSGTLKIYDSCKEAGLPEPEISEFQNGILVTLFKRKYASTALKITDLNKRQITAIEYIKDHKSITNKVYQKINNIGKTTATKELRELVEKGYFNPPVARGRGAFYTLK